MTDDPWIVGQAAAPTPTGAAPAKQPPPLCWHCEREPSTTGCRVCHRPLCADCRIDHYHEGYP